MFVKSIFFLVINREWSYC